ncbi:MAG: WG repeat-containing protein, partial [Clostridia bacterium]|nr:WG repeat-containing protein [Clostridia bacterium]
VIKDGLLGFVDETGAVVIPLTYQSPLPSPVAWYRDMMPYFSEGLAAIWGGDARGNQYGYIDRDGHVVIPFDYDYAAPFSEGLAYVSEGGAIAIDDDHEDETYGRFGFIDKTGVVIVPMVYDCDYRGCGGLIAEQFFSGGLAKVSKGALGSAQYGMIDKAGNSIIPIQYDWIWRFSDGLAFVGFGEDIDWSTWDSCGLVDEKTGREVVAVGAYDGIAPFSEGFAQVGRDERYRYGVHGFVDTAGKEVVPCIFEDARSFSEGLAAVLVDEKWGYIAIVE